MKARAFGDHAPSRRLRALPSSTPGAPLRTTQSKRRRHQHETEDKELSSPDRYLANAHWGPAASICSAPSGIKNKH